MNSEKMKVYPQEKTERIPSISNMSMMSTTDSFKQNIEKTLNASKCDRFKEHWRMVIVVAVPLIGLIIISSISLQKSMAVQKATELGKRSIENAIRYTQFVNLLQQERGMSTIYRSSNNTDNSSLEYLTERRNLVDKSLEETSFPSPGIVIENTLYTKYGFSQYLNKRRQLVNNGSFTVIEVMMNYTIITNSWLKHSVQNLVMPPEKDLYSAMIATSSLVQAIDAYGIQRGLGGTYFYTCNNDYLKLFENLEGQASAYLKIAFSHSSKVENLYIHSEKNISELGTTMQFIGDAMLQTSEVLRCLNMTEEEKFTHSQIWFHNMSTYLNYMQEIQEEVLNDVTSILIRIVKESNWQYMIYIALQVIITVFSIMLSAWYLVTLNRITLKITKYAHEAHAKSKDLAKEKRTTEKLLYRMIPARVANQLKSKGSAPAEHFNDTTIYFSDIVDFTEIGGKCTPMQIVEILNSLYSLFDDCIDKYDVYKVETIGDAYMVASGVPNPNGVRHCFEIARLSLDIRESVVGFVVPWLENVVIEIRIGLHSGPVVAGVIGTKMPRYCLFGDTVNTASRMESTGEGGKIQLSESTYKILQTSKHYTTTKRGLINVKGKGRMVTYWLEKYDPLDIKSVQLIPSLV